MSIMLEIDRVTQTKTIFANYDTIGKQNGYPIMRTIPGRPIIITLVILQTK